MAFKVDPGAKAGSIPFSRFKGGSPNQGDYIGSPKKGIFGPSNKTWVKHNRTKQPFLGQFFINIKHTVKPDHILHLRGQQKPPILLSYAGCERLGILEIKVHDKALHSDQGQNIEHKYP